VRADSQQSAVDGAEKVAAANDDALSEIFRNKVGNSLRRRVVRTRQVLRGTGIGLGPEKSRSCTAIASNALVDRRSVMVVPAP
jgi:hypothetical protein